MVEFLIFTAMTDKGISKAEIESLTNLNVPQIDLLLTLFEDFILDLGGYYRFMNEHLINYIKQNYATNGLPFYHKEIGNALENTPNSVRKLEEQIFHFLECKDFFQLKQIISTIENFLILFNPIHKYSLFQCWQTLINQSYDPVIEYNKSLELFEMHYQPNLNSLFRIVLQLSRFFKELADFETSTVPEFRHPLIKNRLLTLPKNERQKKNELLEQEKLKKQQIMTQTISRLDKSDLFNADENKVFYDDQDSRLEASDFTVEDSDEEIRDHYECLTVNYLEDIGLLRELKRTDLYDKSNTSKVLHGYEKANVDIPNGRMLYKNVFRENISKIREGKKLKIDEDKEALEVVHEDERIDFELEKRRKNQENEKHLKIDNDFKYQADLINLVIDPLREKTYYFYKRWIWLMFPWACLSVDLDCVFSEQIYKCYTNDQKYIKVVDEMEITQKAQLIAIEAKMKKKMVLQDLKGDYLINPSLKKMGIDLENIEASSHKSSITSKTNSLFRRSDFRNKKNTRENLDLIHSQYKLLPFEKKNNAAHLFDDRDNRINLPPTNAKPRYSELGTSSNNFFLTGIQDPKTQKRTGTASSFLGGTRNSHFNITDMKREQTAKHAERNSKFDELSLRNVRNTEVEKLVRDNLSNCGDIVSLKN